MTAEGMTYCVHTKGDNRHDGLWHKEGVHYLRTVQKAIDKIVSRSKNTTIRVEG